MGQYGKWTVPNGDSKVRLLKFCGLMKKRDNSPPIKISMGSLGSFLAFAVAGILGGFLIENAGTVGGKGSVKRRGSSFQTLPGGSLVEAEDLTLAAAAGFMFYNLMVIAELIKTKVSLSRKGAKRSGKTRRSVQEKHVTGSEKNGETSRQSSGTGSKKSSLNMKKNSSRSSNQGTQNSVDKVHKTSEVLSYKDTREPSLNTVKPETLDNVSEKLNMLLRKGPKVPPRKYQARLEDDLDLSPFIDSLGHELEMVRNELLLLERTKDMQERVKSLMKDDPDMSWWPEQDQQRPFKWLKQSKSSLRALKKKLQELKWKIECLKS